MGPGVSFFLFLLPAGLPLFFLDFGVVVVVVSSSSSSSSAGRFFGRPGDFFFFLAGDFLVAAAAAAFGLEGAFGFLGFFFDGRILSSRTLDWMASSTV